MKIYNYFYNTYYTKTKKATANVNSNKATHSEESCKIIYDVTKNEYEYTFLRANRLQNTASILISLFTLYSGYIYTNIISILKEVNILGIALVSIQTLYIFLLIVHIGIIISLVKLVRIENMRRINSNDLFDKDLSCEPLYAVLLDLSNEYLICIDNNTEQIDQNMID